MDTSESTPTNRQVWSAQWRQDEWLAATHRGLWLGAPQHVWRASGPFEHSLNRLARRGRDLIAAADGGLWQIEKGASRWRQLHDELVTVVQDVAVVGDGELLAATGYGVHRPEDVNAAALRWHNCSKSLASPSARFSTAIHIIDRETWVVGTEAGLFLVEGAGRGWSMTPMSGSAVRALLPASTGLWAGNDAGEIWHSADGRAWNQHSRIAPGESVLDLAETPQGLLAGTSLGVALLTGQSWQHLGPPLTIAAVGVDPAQPTIWMAGAAPGGLWWTTDADHWQQVPGAPGVIRQLLPPEASR